MIIFIKADGTAVNVVPSPVYQGSSLAGSLYLVAPFPPTNGVSVAFTLANGDYTTEYAMTSISELDGVTDKLGDEYSIWEWQTQNALVTQFAGTVTAQFKVSYNGQIVATSSVNFTVQRGVQPLPPSEPSADEWQAMLELYGSLAGRVSALENIVETDAPVVTIQKVAPNAFTYTNSKGITSAPIVLDGHGGAGLSSNQASTLLIPQSAWQLVDANNPSAGYKCGISAALHGQMRNGATSHDLWVSFGEVENDNILGVVQSYTVDETGEIMIIVKNPIDLVVRVWNGKGISAIVKWGVNAPSKLSTIEWITVGGN